MPRGSIERIGERSRECLISIDHRSSFKSMIVKKAEVPIRANAPEQYSIYRVPNNRQNINHRIV